MNIMKLHLTAICENKLTSAGVPFESKSVNYLQNSLHWKSKFSSANVAGTRRHLNKISPHPQCKILRLEGVSD